MSPRRFSPTPFTSDSGFLGLFTGAEDAWDVPHPHDFPRIYKLFLMYRVKAKPKVTFFHVGQSGWGFGNMGGSEEMDLIVKDKI